MKTNTSKLINMSKKKDQSNRGAWTSEEDHILSEAITLNGPKKWKTIASKTGLNRCGKSCRLRWMNYLRPNIKRGNITEQEEDLILRLHKLLGNRWSLIAGRLPGRTDNEIKNYWNSRLSKKRIRNEKQCEARVVPNNEDILVEEKMIGEVVVNTESNSSGSEDLELLHFNVDEFFDFSYEGSFDLEWVTRFLDFDSGLEQCS